MSDNIVQLNTELIHSESKDLVKNTVEETLNAMLDAEADRLVNAVRYARDEDRQGYRVCHYDRSFTTAAGEVNLRMPKAAKTVEAGFEETLTFMSFLSQHWLRIRTSNALERLNREIKRRTKVVGTFPDGESALMLVCAKLRHVASSAWGSKRYLNMEHLKSMILSEEEGLIAG